MSKRIYGIFAVMGSVLWMGALAGCQADMLYPTIGDVKSFADLERQQHDAHDKNMGEQHKVMHPEVAGEIDVLRGSFTKEMERIAKETDELRSNHAELLAMALQLGGKVAGLPDSITNAITGDLMPKINDAKDTANVASNVAAGAAKEAEAAAKLAKEKAKELGDKYANFTVKLQDKLASVDLETATALAGATGDKEKFMELLQAKLDLSTAQIGELEGMSPEDIMALIVAAGGATLAGGALGKTGKSRGAADLEALREQINDLRDSRTA